VNSANSSEVDLHDSHKVQENSNQNKNEKEVKFVWRYGGKSVQITGSYNNWAKQEDLIFENNEFHITLVY